MIRTFTTAILLLALPSLAHAADIAGVPKIREGDQVTIGSNRVRLGGIDAPSTDQLCLNPKGERWTCGVAARDELIKNFGNKTNTITLLGLSNAGDPGLENFMSALLNIKNCNTLIKLTDDYKYYTFYKTDKDRESAKKRSESVFFPQLEAIVSYPLLYDYRQEELFDEKGELSGIVLLNKSQQICYDKGDGGFLDRVTLGQLMLAGAKDQNQYSALWLKSPGDAFINLNQYLRTNGLQKRGDLESDPRPAAKSFDWLDGTPTKEGVEKVLTVGAARSR